MRGRGRGRGERERGESEPEKEDEQVVERQTVYVNSTEAAAAAVGALATCVNVVAAAHDCEREACGSAVGWMKNGNGLQPHRTAPLWRVCLE
jgi:hypothetical protein